MCAQAKQLASSRVLEWDGGVSNQDLSLNLFPSLGEHLCPLIVSHTERMETTLLAQQSFTNPQLASTVIVSLYDR